MTQLNKFPNAPLNPRLEESYLRELMKTANAAMNGQLNSTGYFTCATGAASTTVKSIFCNANSVVILTPTTANAATEQGAGSLYVVAGDKQFVVNHINSATTGRTFRYVILG